MPPDPFLICRLRGFRVVATPEERVRQQCIDQLIAWGYPWHTWFCEVGHPRIAGALGRADLCFNWRATGGGPRADAVLEVKVARPRAVDLDQALGYARAFGAGVTAVTDGQIWMVRQRTPAGWVERAGFPMFGEWA